jgi:hypothetical protein
LTTSDQERKKQANALYERFGEPLEAQYRGQCIAISPDDQTLLGNTVLEVLQQGKAAFGSGNFIFKIGDKAVGKWHETSRSWGAASRTATRSSSTMASSSSWRPEHDIVTADEGQPSSVLDRVKELGVVARAGQH